MLEYLCIPNKIDKRNKLLFYRPKNKIYGINQKLCIIQKLNYFKSHYRLTGRDIVTVKRVSMEVSIKLVNKRKHRWLFQEKLLRFHNLIMF